MTLPASDTPEDLAIVRLRGDDQRFDEVRAIRRTVFIVEQSVPEEEEWDGDDARAWHLLASRAGQSVGTLRYFEDDGWWHIGRVAVLPPFRSVGVGRRLMAGCLDELRRLGAARAFLNAQVDKTAFYEKFGFVRVGDVFPDAGIPHIRMEWSAR